MPIFDRILRRGCVVLVVAVAAASPVFALDGNPVEDHRSPLQAFREGAMALRSGNNKEAVSSLQYAADQGHLASAWKLGRMYADGDGVVQNDLKAFELFRKITSERADDSPNAPDARYVSNAFVALGNYWLEGIPGTYVKPNPRRAFDLYQYSATYFGDPEGQYRLGRLYLDGIGAERDPRQAARWLGLAVNKHHHRAQAALGHMLFVGRDLKRQAAYGLMLLTLAKEAASDEETWINTMYEEAMNLASDEERSVALKMVENWLKTANR